MDNRITQRENTSYPSEIREKHRIDKDLIQHFTDYADVKENSAITYKRALKQFSAFLLTYNIVYPERDDILFFRDQLVKFGKKPTTVQNYLNAVKLFFQWTEQERLYPDIAKHIKTPKISKEHKKDYFTSDQSKELLRIIDTSKTKGKRDYAMIFLMITCGLRTEEVANADIGDMRLRGNNTVLYILGKGRTEKAEYVKISVPVEQAIRDYLKERKNIKPTDPMFTSTSNNNKDGRLTTKAIRTAVKEVFKKIGLGDSRHTAHSLRHTAVTLALIAGNDITEVQQFARHRNIDTTMIYDHALDLEKNSCSEDITNLVFENKNHTTLP